MSLDYKKLVFKSLENVLNERTKDIICLRFGINDGQKRTLEWIGQKYGITRERVRQVEEATFSDLKEKKVITVFKPAFVLIDNFLNKEGGLTKEERLFYSLTGAKSYNQDWGALYFILTLGNPYQRFVESSNFHNIWTNSDNAVNDANKLVSQLIIKLEEKEEPVILNDILNHSKKINPNLSDRVISSYVDAAKQIGQNNFGYFGLIKWPEINPRGAKDKAYIVFKEKKNPMHFREVTEFINKANLGSNVAQPQTVHNELIKDERFILVGRGTYALKEWGYQSGTVKDIIIQILKENDSLPKEEILEKVLESRLVKPNTVLINLQNREYFTRNEQGKYLLVK
ncbi:MAG: HTH domain-containing protein [Patescibacteria group bacterium]